MDNSRILSVTILVSMMALTGNTLAGKEDAMVEGTYPNCPDYRLVTTMAAYQEDSLEAMYFIARRITTVWPPETVTLDSIRAVYATATDTNTFIFICDEGQTKHLVVAKTSPTVQFDTLMTQGISPPDNWLAYPETVTIMPTFGIVAGSFGNGIWSGIYEIRRMNRDGTTSLLHTIENAKHMGVSLDHRELYFQIMPDWDGVAYYYVSVYDAVADSFYNLQDPPFSLDSPRRSTKDSPLYYVRALGFDREIWKMMPDGNHERAYSLIRSEKIEYFVETLDSLEVVIRNVFSDSTYKVVFHHYVRWK